MEQAEGGKKWREKRQGEKYLCGLNGAPLRGSCWGLATGFWAGWEFLAFFRQDRSEFDAGFIAGFLFAGFLLEVFQHVSFSYLEYFVGIFQNCFFFFRLNFTVGLQNLCVFVRS